MTNRSVEAESSASTGGTTTPPELHITVNRTPGTVLYRWRTGTGTDWKTAAFAAGDPKSCTVDHLELPHPADCSTAADWIVVDINDPLTVQSNHVPFTVTCESPPPPPGTGGTTDSPSA